MRHAALIAALFALSSCGPILEHQLKDPLKALDRVIDGASRAEDRKPPEDETE